jgi:hypothetical protein
VPNAKAIGLCLLGWMVFNLFWPLDWPMDPRLLAILTGFPQALTLLVAVLALRRAVESAHRSEVLEGQE